MADTPSWWMKFERAQVHRHEAEALLSASTVDQPIRVEREYSSGQWNYTAHHDAEVPSNLPLLVGDFLFNLRSALDHIASANLYRPITKSPFPIYHEDFTAPSAGEPQRFATYRRNWAQLRNNLPPAVFASIELAQPFIACQIEGSNPADSSLSVLNELQNRDKHSSLGVVFDGIGDGQGWISGPGGAVPIRYPTLTAFTLIPSGTQIFGYPSEVDVIFAGTVKFAIPAGPTRAHRPLPELFEDLSAEVQAVLEVIERNMP